MYFKAPQPSFDKHLYKMTYELFFCYNYYVLFFKIPRLNIMVRRSDWIFETSLRRFKNIVYLVSLGWRYPGPGAGVSQCSLLGHSGWGNRTGDFYYDLHFLNLLYTPAFLPNIVTLFFFYFSLHYFFVLTLSPELLLFLLDFI